MTASIRTRLVLMLALALGDWAPATIGNATNHTNASNRNRVKIMGLAQRIIADPRIVPTFSAAQASKSPSVL